MAQQNVLDYIRETPHNSNVNVVKGMLNAEGGGSSDFSTAEVTLVNASPDKLDILLLPLIIDDAVTGADYDQLNRQVSVTRTVPLYKGKCWWLTSLYAIYFENYIFTASGSAVVEEFDILITGDCTITIS